jgi:multiple sugar transport system permease protein
LLSPDPSRIHRNEALGLQAPALVGLWLFTLGPALALAPIAFTDWELGALHARFVGLHNFLMLARDPYFVAAIGHTLVYASVVAPASLVLGLAAALLIDATSVLRSLYRGLLFLPGIATMTAMSVAWEALLHPTVGLVNTLLRGVEVMGPRWLDDEGWALPTLMAIGVWQNFGLAMVFFLAGLRAIPRELHEAAAVDGISGTIDRLRHVVLPMVGPVALFVLVLIAERAFSVFDTVRVLTKGGPGTSTEVLLHLLFTEGVERLRAGYGAAIAINYLALLVTLVFMQRRVFEAQVHYQ